jgi:hypothetical protein
MEEIIQFCKGFNLQTIISIFLMLWYFANHIESKIEKQSQRTDRLYEMFIDLIKEKKGEK